MEQNNPSLILSREDFEKLSNLVAMVRSEVGELLEEELGRAKVVANEELPEDVVSMNSKVVFKDLESGQEKVVTLVFPNEANVQEGKISVLAPVGAALIGLRVGQVIDWPMPGGREKKFKVTSIVSQPQPA